MSLFQRKTKKRVPVVPPVSVGQLALPIALEDVPQADLSAGAAESFVFHIGKSSAKIFLSKVCWNLDLQANGTVLPVPFRDAIVLGAPAIPVPPTVTKADKLASMEYGFASEDLKEYFIKSEAMSGVLRIRKTEAGWTATSSETNVPYVLSKAAVDAAHMPPLGTSALPVSLECVTPVEFRYWKAADATQASMMRKALVDANFFSDRLVRIVDGDIRLCVERLFLYEPGPTSTTKSVSTLLEALSFVIPTSVRTLKMRSPLTDQEKDWKEITKGSESELLVLSARTDAEFAEVVSELEKGTVKQQWLVEYQDTNATRISLSKLGRIFKVTTPDAADRVFVASFPANKLSSLVTFVQPNSEDPKPKPIETFKQHEIRFLAAKAEQAPDERYVMGVVLEPLDRTPDAQNDVYDAPTIRKTAHLFMSDFRTIGLMHKGTINDKVKILESYIAPCDFDVNGAVVKAGSWILAARVVDDELWKACKSGELTGWSIGGTAIRKPVDETTSV